MTSRGSEELKAAFRRSLRLIIGLIVVGVIAVNVFEQAKGASYQASSRVQVPPTTLAQTLNGTAPAAYDPQELADNAKALAESTDVYTIARNQTRGKLGDAGSLQGATSVSEVADTQLLQFTSTSSSPARAQQIANAVARGYVTFYDRNANSNIVSTIQKVQQSLNTATSAAEQRLYQGELTKLQALEGENASNVTITQQAVSADKTSPAPLKDTILGFVLGLVVALILVAVREAIDTKVRSEGDVEDALGVPVLARVRPMPKKAKMVSYGRHQALFSDTYALLAAQLAPTKDLRTPKVIAVTSAVAQEGKTTTAANLAVALARRGAHVILADFDFRKPDLTRLFNVPDDSPGALQLFTGEANLNSVLWDITLEGAMPRAAQNGQHLAFDEVDDEEPSPNGKAAHGSLRLLPAGGIVSPDQDGQTDPLPLRPLLQLLRMRANVVVVDTAPALLTADMTDFAERVDAAVVVVRQGFASKRNLRLYAQYAESWPTQLAGAVLTDVPVPSELAGYYGSR